MVYFSAVDCESNTNAKNKEERKGISFYCLLHKI